MFQRKQDFGGRPARRGPVFEFVSVVQARAYAYLGWKSREDRAMSTSASLRPKETYDDRPGGGTEGNGDWALLQ